MSAREKWAFSAILALALALRLVAVLALPAEEDWPDTEQFVGIARTCYTWQGSRDCA